MCIVQLLHINTLKCKYHITDLKEQYMNLEL